MQNSNILRNFWTIGLCLENYFEDCNILEWNPFFLQKIICSFKSIFLKGRRPVDNAIVIQEVINNFKHSSVGNFMLKLDLEKAYDKLEWSFVYSALVYLKFPTTSLNSSCLVLIPRLKTSFFNPTWGKRQEDPLSPIFSSWEWKCFPITLITRLI